MYNSYNSSSNAYKIKKHNKKTPVRISHKTGTQIINEHSTRHSILLVSVIISIIACFMYSMINYIDVISDFQTNQRKISYMELELANLKESNDTKEHNIFATINYAEVYKIATEELAWVILKVKTLSNIIPESQSMSSSIRICQINYSLC